jgi:hypothetical protein
MTIGASFGQRRFHQLGFRKRGKSGFHIVEGAETHCFVNQEAKDQRRAFRAEKPKSDIHCAERTNAIRVPAVHQRNLKSRFRRRPDVSCLDEQICRKLVGIHCLAHEPETSQSHCARGVQVGSIRVALPFHEGQRIIEMSERFLVSSAVGSELRRRREIFERLLGIGRRARLIQIVRERRRLSV